MISCNCYIVYCQICFKFYQYNRDTRVPLQRQCYKMLQNVSHNPFVQYIDKKRKKKRKKGYLCSNTFASCYIPVVVSRSAFESSSWKRNCSGFSTGDSHENSVKRFPSWSPNWYGYLTNNAICHASISITER